MKNGDVIYGAFPGIDTFIEKVGPRQFMIKARCDYSGELLGKLHVIDYGKKQALRRAEQMAREIIAARSA